MPRPMLWSQRCLSCSFKVAPGIRKRQSQEAALAINSSTYKAEQETQVWRRSMWKPRGAGQ